VTAFEHPILFRQSADLNKNELLILPMQRDLTLIWHCICALFSKINCRISDCTEFGNIPEIKIKIRKNRAGFSLIITS
jgi:hypothetical protein